MEEIIAPISKELIKAELTEEKRLRMTNKSNNEISNLELLTKEEHLKLHGDELKAEEREWRRKNIINNPLT